jgi:hypothetical protein
VSRKRPGRFCEARQGIRHGLRRPSRIVLAYFVFCPG